MRSFVGAWFFVPKKIYLFIVIALLSGCVSSSPDERWEPVVRHDGNQVHLVKWQDETLAAIARWYTGSGKNLDAIANANPTLDPALMQQGDEVFIPHQLLKTRGDMSRVFLDTFLSSAEKKKQQGSGVVLSKKPRILSPVAYKKRKKPQEDASLKPSSLKDKPVIIPPPPVKPLSELPKEERKNLHLFGPK